MDEKDLTKLRELSLLLDLAYMHHFEGESANYKSAEATIRLEFGNFWWRKDHQSTPPNAPQIEAVVIYSSVFSAARVCHFDSLDDALVVVQGWYEQARERNLERGAS
ncbi:MAG TPA: hypothetical protein VFU07_05130 [Candidatus Lumbricidophila sp.]|nr:hypothetical protein [Candidatus Lumbricidophila sp.]